jgi:glucose-1-phosphate cytidylyltransferase
MKTVILAGGMGTRLGEETEIKPKPMVEIGGKPMLWHLMNIYSAHGFCEFIVALGYRGDCIKRYFLDFGALNNDLTVDLSRGESTLHRRRQPGWKVHLVDTGLNTETGGRIKRLREWIGEETFLLTYGDGLADVNIRDLLAFHQSHGKLATVSAVRPPARFGGLRVNGAAQIAEFAEKPSTGEGWVNGGFFVLEPGVTDFISGDETIWERDPLERLARQGELMAYHHQGFWQPMDTAREKLVLEKLWDSGQAPWKVWN